MRHYYLLILAVGGHTAEIGWSWDLGVGGNCTNQSGSVDLPFVSQGANATVASCTDSKGCTHKLVCQTLMSVSIGAEEILWSEAYTEASAGCSASKRSGHGWQKMQSQCSPICTDPSDWMCQKTDTKLGQCCFGKPAL